jgi:HD superfamily phosphohydrolase
MKTVPLWDDIILQQDMAAEGFEDEYPIFYHPLTLNMSKKAQLGPIKKENMGAWQDRFWHAAIRTRNEGLPLCGVLYRKGMITLQDVRNLHLMFIVHDIGHSFYSHGSEYPIAEFTGENHKQRGIRILRSAVRDPQHRTLKDIAHSMGADLEAVIAMLEGKNPIGEVCSHALIGADKRAYMHDDPIWYGASMQAPDMNALNQYYAFIDNTLGLEMPPGFRSERIIWTVRDMRRLRNYLHGEVYYEVGNLIRQRFLERITESALVSGIIKPAEIDYLGDSDFDWRMQRLQGDQPLVARMRDDFAQFNSLLPTYAPIIRFKYERGVPNGSHFMEIDQTEATVFLQKYSRPSTITALEERVSELIKVPCIITTIPDLNKQKPADVTFFDNGETTCMKELQPDHYELLQKLDRSYFAIHVCVPNEEQDRLVKNGTAIAKDIWDLANAA